ncbi:MAG: 4Fe-4S dicluster domain-containing protein [Anaerolineae bacterium]
MTQRFWLPVEGEDAAGALRKFLAGLLTSGYVDALLVPCRLAGEEAVMPALVESVEALEACEPLAPVMSHNMATMAGRITVLDTGRQVGVWLRPCELRALIELTKLHQATLEHVRTIGVDCLGTYEVVDYAAMVRAGKQPAELWQGATDGNPQPADGYALRTACRMCEYPAAANPDIRIGLIGLDFPRQVLVESREPLPMELPPAEIPSRRQEVLSRLQAQRTAARDTLFASWRMEVPDLRRLAERFATCIRCHNCMVACPICYCKECIFRTPTFDHEPEQYFRWAERKGAVRMPTDTLLFHITRLNHMASSCVGCGLCESACPSHLPVATLFRSVAQSVQALFDYEAGRSLDEELPLATFREDELTDLGK